MIRMLLATLLFAVAGCATLTEDAMTPVALSFSDGSAGSCNLTNKRGAWASEIPATYSVRKSDDALKYECETSDGRVAVGSIASEMGGKIVASAVFLDLGITDAITDKHRQYPPSFVIPLAPKDGEVAAVETSAGIEADNSNGRQVVYEELETLNDLHERGVITDTEFAAEKKRLLESE